MTFPCAVYSERLESELKSPSFAGRIHRLHILDLAWRSWVSFQAIQERYLTIVQGPRVRCRFPQTTGKENVLLAVVIEVDLPMDNVNPRLPRA